VTESFDAAEYANLESRVKGLIRSIEGSFPPEQIAQLIELAEHNEPAVAVEMLSRMVIERGAPVTQSLFDEVRSLEETMRLAPCASEQLRPLLPGS
jgi:hypothetical protein